MKKFLSTLLAAILALIPISVSAQCTKKPFNPNVSISDLYNNDYTSESVMTLNSSEINTINDNIDLVKTFIRNGGILVINNDIDNTVSLCQDLNMQIEPELFVSDAETYSEIVESDNGKDLVTIYYNYGDGLSGVYVINSKSNITKSEKEVLIAAAIDEIHDMQNSESGSLVQPLAASANGKTLGSFTVTSTCLPKGKVKATYTFYTVQNYHGKDYYTAKANIVGYPGATLSSTDKDYKSKYKGLSLKAVIKTGTDSVTVNAYGPHRTVDKSTYSVSVGAAFNADLEPSFSANFGYSKTIYDTNIEATSTPKQAQWDVELKSNARTKSITFVPAITFVCPDSKASINISCSTSYTLDSWDTLKETISANRNVTCKPSSVTAQ